jgi:hypothetical protein
MTQVDASPSPVEAVNFGLTTARGELVGVMIDGARLATPGVVASILQAARLHSRPVIGTVAFHLGPEVQMVSVQHGYDQEAEDSLLATVDWVEDGYRLFKVSTFAASSADGWFTTPSEANLIVLRSEQWRELNGFDPAFRSPGGGLANLDIWARACGDPTSQVILLLGEATFHQFHGGVATNARKSPFRDFHAEYVRIRGKDYERPSATPLLVGRFPDQAWPSVLASKQFAEHLKSQLDQHQIVAERQSARSSAEIQNVQASLAATQQELRSTAARVGELEGLLTSVFTSRSWRITGPFRAAIEVARHTATRAGFTNR